MALALQVVGVVLAVTMVARLLHGPARPTTVVALLVVGVGAAAIPLVPSAYGTLRGLDAQRGSQPDPASGPGLDHAFFAWAAERMPPRTTFALVPFPENPLAQQWAPYQLAPRRLVEPEEADFVLLYNVEPRDARYDRAAFSPPELMTPVLGIAERRDAR